MTKAKIKTVPIDASTFLGTGNTYIFPFVCLDPTPGGRNIGRIEWHLEPLRKGNRIASLLIWASQTHDERYVGKVFDVPCQTEALTSRLSENSDDYFCHVWRAGFCAEHKTLSFSAYPANHHTELVVESSSSIGNRVYFR